MKKLLLFILSFIILLVGAFFAVGFVVPKFEYTNRVEIDRPADVVWDYFADASKAKDWIRGLKSMELIEGQPNTPGAKFKMEFEDDGRQITMTETVKTWKPREEFAFKLENEVMISDTTVRFTEQNGKTTVVQTVNAQGGNPFWRSLFALMRGTFESQGQEIMENLKRNVEKQ